MTTKVNKTAPSPLGKESLQTVFKSKGKYNAFWSNKKEVFEQDGYSHVQVILSKTQEHFHFTKDQWVNNNLESTFQQVPIDISFAKTTL